MLPIAHSAHWLLEAGPLLVVPPVVLIWWLRAERSRRAALARAVPPPAAARGTRRLRPDARERPPHA